MDPQSFNIGIGIHRDTVTILIIVKVGYGARIPINPAHLYRGPYPTSP